MKFGSNLIGTFNAYNLLAIYGTAVELGLDKLGGFTISYQSWKVFPGDFNL